MGTMLALLLALQDEKPKLKKEDVKKIVEREIFFPAEPKKEVKIEPKKEPEKKKTDPPPVKEPAWPVVTGFEMYPDGARLLVTDREKNQSARYKVGDALAGGTITRIDAVHAVIEFPSGSIELRNGDPVKDKMAPASTSSKKPAWVAGEAATIPGMVPVETGPSKKRASDQMEEEDPTPRKKKNGR